MADDVEKDAEDEDEEALLAAAPAGLSRDRLEIKFLEQRIRSLKHEADKLVEQRPLLLAALRYQHIGDLTRIALQIMFGIVALMIVVALLAAMWSAAQDNNLVIEAFSVPPDMAQRGVSGQVVASQLLDRLATLQNETPTARAASTYSNNWGRDDIKVAIPDTGISIGDLNHYLRDWLGHETHITGEVYRSDTGIVVTARVGGDPGVTFEGSQADLGKLMQKAADAIYKRTQPYRYAVYLLEHNQAAQSDVVLRNLLAWGPKSEAKWAHLGLSNSLTNATRYREAVGEANAALAEDQDFGMAYNLIALDESRLGHDEAALAALHNGLHLLTPGRDPEVSPRAATIMHAIMDAQLSAALGDFRAAAGKYQAASELPDYNALAGLARIERVQMLALDHDSAAFAGQKTFISQTLNQLSEYSASAQLVPTAFGQWDEASYNATAVLIMMRVTTNPKNPNHNVFTTAGFTAALPCRVEPMAAIAFAHRGQDAMANAYLGGTPLDCYLALRARAQVAATEGHPAEAEHWFAIALEKAPSIPFAESEWGAMLLAKGDADGAIAKFKSAAVKGPHFADPLEGWGEALMAKKRSDLAVAKFAQAAPFAPNWGRLHLKWAEALDYAGRHGEAGKEYLAASSLYLTPAEKNELAAAMKRDKAP